MKHLRGKYLARIQRPGGERVERGSKLKEYERSIRQDRANGCPAGFVLA